jgi:uncharacterized membrane protein YebE (DUF533 family)
MSFGNILGQILQDGLGGQTQTQSRLQNAAQSLDRPGGGFDSILGQIQGALGRAGVDTAGLGAAAGGFADKAKSFAREEQVGGLTGAQIGGIGAIAGALLGGGLGGAARGGAMAVLGTLALGALKRAQARQAGVTDPAPLEPHEVTAVAGPDAERLFVKAMISAAKADGQIDKTEMQKIIGRVGKDSVTDAEKQFVLDEMQAPLDVAALAAEARDPAQAAGVYAASILTIDADTDQEKAYLQDLAQALKLDPETVRQLREMTGATA